MSLSEKLTESAAAGYSPERVTEIKAEARRNLAAMESDCCYDGCGCNEDDIQP